MYSERQRDAQVGDETDSDTVKLFVGYDTFYR